MFSGRSALLPTIPIFESKFLSKTLLLRAEKKGYSLTPVHVQNAAFEMWDTSCRDAYGYKHVKCDLNHICLSSYLLASDLSHV